jgi:hypothetical protein
VSEDKLVFGDDEFVTNEKWLKAWGEAWLKCLNQPPMENVEISAIPYPCTNVKESNDAG